MFVGVARPELHHGQRAGEIAAEEFADGEFTRGEAGEPMQRCHGFGEMVVAVLADKIREHQPHEAVVDAGCHLAEDGQRGAIVRG